MVRAREIGWGDKEKLLWQISKQLDSLICVWCNVDLTTQTTTEAPFICNNILLNSGFEDWTPGEGGDLLDDWSSGIQEAIIVHSGNYSVVFNTNEASTYQEFTPTTTCLTLDLWWNTEDTDCAHFLIVRGADPSIYLQADGTWSSDIYYFDLSQTSGEWENYILAFNTTAGLVHSILIWGEPDCLCYFDDVQICDSCETPPTTTTTTTTESLGDFIKFENEFDFLKFENEAEYLVFEETL